MTEIKIIQRQAAKPRGREEWLSDFIASPRLGVSAFPSRQALLDQSMSDWA